jgi:type IX secretion system PorP/SprF family membrane protein
MKITTYIFVILLSILNSISGLKAQQLPVLNHYVYNPYLYNPARAGQNSHGSIYANFKKQWVNMPQSPITGILSLETPVFGKTKNMGMGAMIYTDQMHIISKIGAVGSYAYHIQFAEEKSYKNQLSVGLSMGFLNQRINFPAADVINSNDIQVLAKASNGTVFDFSMGADYHYKDLHIGLSMLQGLNNKMRLISANDTNKVRFINSRHFLFSTSYRFNAEVKDKGIKYYIEPVLLTRFVKSLPSQLELSVIGGVYNIGWLGISYRSNNTETITSAVSVTAGVEINNKLRMAYTVDFGVGKNINNSLGLQHEFMIAYRLQQGNDSKVNSVEKIPDLSITPVKEDSIVSESTVTNENITENSDGSLNIEQELIDRIVNLEKEKFQLEGAVIAQREHIENLKSMLEENAIAAKHLGEFVFEESLSRLTKDTKAKIGAFAKQVDKSKTIYIYGNGSMNGDAKSNMDLAVKRGAIIRDELIKLGFDAETVKIVPMGEYSSNSKTSKTRRVDIMVTDGQ